MPPRKETSGSEAGRKKAFGTARANLTANLRRLRKAAGLSQAALAEKTDLSLVYVTALEGLGAQNPTLATLAALAHALGVTPHELLAPAPKPTRREPGRPRGERLGG